MSRDQFLFLPLGGAGEIGMNLNLFGFRDRWLMVDLGITFGNSSTPGIDVVTPDPRFIAERRDKLDGLVLTHAHEDHLGAVVYLWPRLQCPIYATGFTASVLRRKLSEAGLEEEVSVTLVDVGMPFDIGPFNIELVRLTHSIPEPNALVIRTPLGSVFHTGDWKLDPDPLIGEAVDEAAIRRIGDDGVLALIGDSTNIFNAGRSGSEASVRESLKTLVARYQGRVAIAAFASNVARLETIAEVATATGRHAALCGRSLWRMNDVARENGYLRNIPSFLTEEEASHLPRDKVLIACTGSQGESRAALARIASDTHPRIVLNEGDTVIFSSRKIPGNELAISRLQNMLVHRGIEIVTESDHFVHVSGHPARDELIDMYRWIQPQIAVPVHGERLHLHEHARLARRCQVPQALVATNGDMVRLAPGPAQVVETVHAGRLAVEGDNLLPIDGPVVRERRRLMFNGAVMATVIVDCSGNLLDEAIVTLAGLGGEDDEKDDALYQNVTTAITDAIDELSPNTRRADNVLERAARGAIRRVIRKETGKKPITDVHVVRLTPELITSAEA
ncbi:MAG: ribonuclease J [Rhodospirillaceae bacterium]|nr:ribonuclease J [Rhodospirillaceae bacterium]